MLLPHESITVVFNDNDVKAAVNGRKTTFRIPLSMQKPADKRAFPRAGPVGLNAYHAGDVVYVKEAYHICPKTDMMPIYRADFAPDFIPEGIEWSIAASMPIQYARVKLYVRSSRVERLHAISDGDALREGLVYCASEGKTAVQAFAEEWDKTQLQSATPLLWKKNPWVEVVEFSLMGLKFPEAEGLL